MKSNPSNWRRERRPEDAAAGSLRLPAANSLARRSLREFNRLLNRFFNSSATSIGVPIVEGTEQLPAPARRRHPFPSFSGSYDVGERNFKDWRSVVPRLLIGL